MTKYAVMIVLKTTPSYISHCQCTVSKFSKYMLACDSLTGLNNLSYPLFPKPVNKVCSRHIHVFSVTNSFSFSWEDVNTLACNSQMDGQFNFLPNFRKIKFE